MTPIPRTLEEAVEQIIGQMTLPSKAAFASAPERYAGTSLHFYEGMAMRNDWGLWHGETPISAFLRAHRIVHGDDQSQTIYQAVHRALNGKPIDDVWLAERAAYYERYWAKSGVTWDQKPIPGFVDKPGTRWFKLTEGGLMEEVDGLPGDPTQEEGV